MIQIGDTLVSLDLIEAYFLCDLAQCKGVCCVEGDSGAPLDKSEIAQLEKALPVIWDDLSPEAQAIINKQGVAYIDCEGDIVTSIVNGKDCVFTCYDSDGTCKCAVEKAYRLSTNRYPATFIRCALPSTKTSAPSTTTAGKYVRLPNC